MSRILVLQHIGCEPPGAYGEELDERGLSAETRASATRAGRCPTGAPTTRSSRMGGPMGAYEEAIHPWLAAEKRLIGEAVRAGTPYWGVCLGAQLLAASLGASVMPGPRPEVGVAPVELTAAAAGDPVFARRARELRRAALARRHLRAPASAPYSSRARRAYEQQAFVFAGAYGLQFHLEAGAGLVSAWARVPAYAAALAAPDARRGGRSAGCSPSSAPSRRAPPGSRASCSRAG